MEFFRKYKKIIIAIIFLGIICLLGYLIWQTFFKANINNTIPSTDTETTNIGGLNLSNEGDPNYSNIDDTNNLSTDDSNERTNNNTNFSSPDNSASNLAIGGITKTKTLTTDPVLDPTMTSNNQLRYYNSSDGKFYTLNDAGELVTLSDKVFHQVSNVTWSSDGDQAILEYPDGSKINYNFDTQKQVTLPSHWEDFSFSPTGDSISAKSMGDDIENRYLITANADGSRAQSLSAIGNNADDVYPIWSPSNQVAALYTRGVDFNRQEVFFVGLNNENFKSTIINGRGFEPQWSDQGDTLLYSVYSSDNDMNPSLWLVDAQGDDIGQNRTNLNLSTWASKCTFASNSDIYCAVPEDLPEGSGLFPELADKTSDLLYKINSTTGSKKLIAIPENASNISNIMVGSDQEILYFTDQTTGQIYSIQLK